MYLAAVMAAYAQKGLPAFSIYGHDVQDMTDKEIPADVAEKLLRFAHAAAAVGWLKNKASVNLGGIAMGIALSLIHISRRTTRCTAIPQRSGTKRTRLTKIL